MEEVLYTVHEVAELIKSNGTYVYRLINSGVLPALKLGSMKVRKQALHEFLEKYEGKDLSVPESITEIAHGSLKNE
ncbi:MAG: helix-turn-helix domain-containing protein [Eubacteriales bacterium]